MAKLPTISTGSFERLRGGRGLKLWLIVSVGLGIGLGLYFWFGK